MSGLYRAGLDGGVVIIILGAIVGALPTIAGVLGVLYYCLLIWRDPTFAQIVAALSRRLRRNAGKAPLIQPASGEKQSPPTEPPRTN